MSATEFGPTHPSSPKAWHQAFQFHAAALEPDLDTNAVRKVAEWFAHNADGKAVVSHTSHSDIAQQVGHFTKTAVRHIIYRLRKAGWLRIKDHVEGQGVAYNLRLPNDVATLITPEFGDETNGTEHDATWLRTA